MAQALTFASILQNLQVPENISPQTIRLPSPPKLEGALKPNNLLSTVQIHANGKVIGPESMVVYKGYVYTGQADGWVVEVSPTGVSRKIARLSSNNCGQVNATEGACGRPLGMRLDNHGYLVAADAYHGIIRINPRTGELKHLVDSRNLLVNGKPLGYVNDLAIAKDDTIFFTSSSTKWTIAKESNIVFEAENTGRVLVYHPNVKEVKELVTKLTFPNGLQLSEDESHLLIAESTRSRILRAWIGSNSTKFGTMELFTQNLPGLVDNIRLSPRGTYWVGISQSRHSHLPNVLDKFGDQLRLRAALIMMVNNNVMFDNPKFGVVLELDADGKVLRSLQDPVGWRYTSVSEIAEESGLLYFASPGKKFIGYMKLSSLDKAESELPLKYHPAVMEFLRKTNANLLTMTDARMMEVVLELVKEIVRTRQQTAAYNRMSYQRARLVMQLQQRVNAIESQRNNSSSSSSGGQSGITTIAGPVTTPSSAAVTANPVTPTAAQTTTTQGVAVTTTTAASAITTSTAPVATTSVAAATTSTAAPATTSTPQPTTTAAGEAITTTLAE